MRKRFIRMLVWPVPCCIVISLGLMSGQIFAAEKLIGIHSARVMSQSMPWIAQEAGLFRRYDLDFRLVYIGSSPLATAAMLGGDAELLLDGGLGTVRAVVQGNTDLVFIGGIKNILTQSILAKPEIKRLEDLRGKKVGVTRFGSTTHYFATGAHQRRRRQTFLPQTRHFHISSRSSEIAPAPRIRIATAMAIAKR